MTTRIHLTLVAAALLASPPARAADKAACLDAASKGQSLRDQNKLVEARDKFRTCAEQGCPAMVVQDCSNWLSEIETNVPTVVFTAKDSGGNDIVDVGVSIDGTPLIARLDGHAVAMNPGSHVFHFQRADGTTTDKQVLVTEGKKNQEVLAVLGTAPVPSPSIPAAPQGVAPAPDVTSSTRSPSSLPTIGWVLGSLGIVGLGVGSAFGIVSINDKNGAHCDANNFCDPGALSSGRSAALGSDIGFIAGGVFLAGGITLVLLAPSGGGRTALRLTPLIAADGGGATVGGGW